MLVLGRLERLFEGLCFFVNSSREIEIKLQLISYRSDSLVSVGGTDFRILLPMIFLDKFIDAKLLLSCHQLV